MTDWTEVFNSQSVFVAAAFTTPKAAVEAAQEVLCILNNGEVLTVKAIINRCCDHTDRSQEINYEDWSCKTEQLIQSHIDMQEGVPKEALRMAQRCRSEFLRIYHERSKSPEVQAVIEEMKILLADIDYPDLYLE
ncbi:MAG: hypothetical protein ACTS9Y_00610 [Methylophilus sp.]|uniref:hypothetical protein n=1 Tax=Methylophilus sp. TaxID=29541 RepID=UPI003FA02E23